MLSGTFSTQPLNLYIIFADAPSVADGVSLL